MPKLGAGEDGWSEWVRPLPGFRFGCCDCGLTHELDFRVLSEAAANEGRARPVKGRVEFRARRNERSTAQYRRYPQVCAPVPLIDFDLPEDEDAKRG